MVAAALISYRNARNIAGMSEVPSNNPSTEGGATENELISIERPMLLAAAGREEEATEAAAEPASLPTGEAEAKPEAGPEPEADLEAEGAPNYKVTSTGCAAIPRRRGREAWRPRGQRRSFGRLCKGTAAAGGCTGDGDASAAAAAKRKWTQEQQRKEMQLAAREAERQARAAKENIRVQRRKQREARRQQKKENEMKSAKVQVIKDTTKIRKWSKQARRQLVKMSPEMIRQLYGVQL